MAIAITLRGFNDLGRFGDPYFSSDWSFSLLIFYILRKKWKSTRRSLNFLQNASMNSVHLTSSFSCVAVSNASLRVTTVIILA